MGFARSLRRVLSVFALPALLLLSTRAFSSSQDLFGMGARGAAMGGAVVSNSAGYSSLYYNPAGLVRLDQSRFSVGYQRADYLLELNGGAYDVAAPDNLVIGMNVPLPFGGVLAHRLTLGVGFILPMASVLLADIPRPEEPSFVVLDNRAETVGLHMGLGVRVFDWLWVGGGVVALAELIGGLDVAPNDTGNLGTQVRDELVADYAPILGILAQPLDWLAIGVAFHDESAADFTFPITADLGPDFPIEVPPLNIVGTAQYDPLQVSADVSVTPWTGVTIAAGATFKQWSAFENPIENTVESLPPQDPPAFDDIFIPRLGAEVLHPLESVELAYRAGFFYEPTPVPEQTGNHNYLDSSRVGVSAGFGLRWREITFDAAVQLQASAERTHTKDAETVRNPENAGLPAITHDGSLWVTAFDLGVAF